METATREEQLDGLRAELRDVGALVAEMSEQLEGLRVFVMELVKRQERFAGVLEDITGEDV